MNKSIYILGLICICWFIAITSFAQKTYTIAISKCHPTGADTLWLRHFIKDVKFVNLYGLSYHEALLQLQSCDGLVLTGGEDINPTYYGQSSQMNRCGKIDNYRDTLEMTVILSAIKHKMPVLGICRGNQMINVANNGSLIIDIPADVPNALAHNTVNGNNALHHIKMLKGTQLSRYVSDTAGIVNSYHHQCVNTLAHGLQVVAKTDDGVIEAIESKDDSIFMTGVQWHPERLDYNSPFSSGIALAFLKAIIREKEN